MLNGIIGKLPIFLLSALIAGPALAQYPLSAGPIPYLTTPSNSPIEAANFGLSNVNKYLTQNPFTSSLPNNPVFTGTLTGPNIDGTTIGAVTPAPVSTNIFSNPSSSSAMLIKNGPYGSIIGTLGGSNANLSMSTSVVAPGLPTSITSLGAKCDGVTDDTSAINSGLSTLTSTGIGRVSIPAGQMCLINTGNVTVPAGVIIEGQGNALAFNAYTFAGGTGFLLNPAYEIILNGGQLRDVVIYSKSLTANPTPTQASAAVTAWGSTYKTPAVFINAGGAGLFNDFIVGFNECIKAVVGNFSISQVNGDCYNGMEVTGAGDNFYADNVRFEPYYSFNTNSADTHYPWARPGVAFNLHDGDTGGVFSRLFSFMWRTGVLTSNIGGNQIANSGFEWQTSIDPNAPISIGHRFVTSNAAAIDVGNYYIGFDIGISAESTGQIGITAPEIQPVTNAFYLGGQSATPQNLTVGGSVTAGATISATLTSSSITGTPLTVTYTANAGDSIASVANGLADAINRNNALQAARVYAGANSGVVTIYWAVADTVTVSSATTSTLTVSQATGSAAQGSYGIISEANLANQSGLFLVAPNVLNWEVNGIHTGLPALPSGWLSIDSSSIAFVSFNIKWSHEYNGPTSCGAGAYVLGTDHDGAISEGPSSTGCTITFYTPWVTAPTCSLYSPSGTTITGSTTSTTALTYTHASASSVTVNYRCTVPPSP